MKLNYNLRNYLPNITRAMSLGVGMMAMSAYGQGIIEVGGDGVIADVVLDPGSALSVDTADNWAVEGSAAGGGNFIESHLVSPAVVVTATGNVTLSFDHRYFFETDFDGGGIYVSVNGAAATYVPTSSLTGQIYDGTANAGTAWAGGEEVFNGKSPGYDTPVFVQTTADLGVLNAGDTVSVEFRGGWDEGFIEPGLDWEINTVKITDAGAADILDVDFPVDGSSGFTLDTAGGGTLDNPWEYKKPTHRFELDADLLTADSYSPNGAETVIDLNDANIAVSILAGTLDAGDSFALFDLSGGVTLTGSIATLSLPPGAWDTSNLEVDGTITCLDPTSPLIQESFADLDSTLNGNTPGLGLTGTWNAESFVADSSLIYGGLRYEGGRAITNPTDNIQVNEISPGTTLTDAGLMADGATLWFSALIVNHNPPSGDNRTYLALGTGAADGFDRIGGNSGSGFTAAVSKVTRGAVTAQAWNDGSAGSGGASRGATVPVTDGATFLAVGKITWGEFGVTPDTFELYLPDEDLVLGAAVSTITADFDQLGTADVANAFNTISFAGAGSLSGVPEVDEIRFGTSYGEVTPLDVTAPVIVSTDPIDDSPSGTSNKQIATFNEPVFAGAGDIRIVNDTDAVTTTIAVGDPQIVVSGNTLTITPTVPLTGGKAYHIEIDAGAVTNYNLLDFGGISSATEWNFIADGAPPALTSIEDDVSPLPILIDSSLTYTVTFAEPIDGGTIDTSDFANGGSASVTVDSVTATGDPAVYEVGVSTIAAGDLTLEIVAGAVITDLSGNALDTTTAIPDDTTIAVNNPTPTAASVGVDFQATIASEQHPDYDGEARYYHVSVNPANAGTGSYAATIVGTNDPAPTFVRNYTGPVVSYKFVGGTNNDITSVAMSGGDDSLITYSTEDPDFDGFGQQQAKIWDATDPGADIQTSVASPYFASADKNGGGFRSLGGAVGRVDISSLASGSLHIYYGAFGSTPSVRVTMRDTDNVAADIVIADAHSIADGGNGDAANRTEYYLAEIDFETDGFYDVIEYEWLANGSDYSGNGRGLGTVLTGSDTGTSNDFATWISGFTLADTSFSGDDDGDDLDNGLEAFFGTDPSAFSTGLAEIGKSGSTVTFTHPNPDAADVLSDVTGSYEWSADLMTWYQADGAEGPGATTVTTVATPDSPEANVTTVAVTIAGTVPEKLFLRVVATQP